MFSDETRLQNIKESQDTLPRYLGVDSDSKSVTASVVYFIIEENSGIVIYGAYYGYCGGGENDGGYFLIDIENAENKLLGYDDVEALSQEHPIARDLFEYLMSQVWVVMDDNDGQLEPNEVGVALLNADNEGVHLGHGFDGDALADISQEWPLTLKFED
jgi:hypothetical protein